MESLNQYSFLKASLEDIELISKILSLENKFGSPRHAICLMHDAIEFILYEILILEDIDIYKNGQNTIGLDKAISECRNIGVDIPLISTIRSIQKHRGDAKHHAQVPHEKAYQKLIAEFRIITSRLIYEQFGEALKCEIDIFELSPHHVTLYDSYRKYRNHNWKLACKFIIEALIYKHRLLLRLPIDYKLHKIQDNLKKIELLKQEIAKAKYIGVPKKVVVFIKSIPTSFINYLQVNNLTAAAELAGKAYSKIDEVIPSIFDIRTAKLFSPHLALPKRFKFNKSMSWSKYIHQDTEQKENYDLKLKKLLKINPRFVKSFGSPNCDDDGDSVWRWWEFAVFDCVKWHSFHLDDSFQLYLESGELKENLTIKREQLTILIYEKFKEAIELFNKHLTICLS